MPHRSAFRHLRDLQPHDVDAPDYVWLAYAVCADDDDACGWGGWIIESAFRRDGATHPTGTGDRLLSADYEQRCPRCGRTTYRTAVSRRMVPSGDQVPPRREGIDYEVADEDPTRS